MAERQSSQKARAMTKPAKKGYRRSKAKRAMSRDNKGLRVNASGPLPPMVLCCMMSASIMVLQEYAFQSRPPKYSGKNQPLLMGPQPLDQGHELAIEGQPAVFIWGYGRGGAVMEVRRRAPLQCRQRASQVGPGPPRLAL